MPSYKNSLPALLVFFIILFSCKNNAAQYKSPIGYDINKPEKFVLTSSLTEISGITFIAGKKDTIFAIEDETGKLFSIALGGEKPAHSRFAKRGDFEDVAVLNSNTVAVLKSNGSIFLFPVAEIGKERIDSVQQYDGILPQGEYEGLSGFDGKLYVLCKNCTADNEKKEVSVFTLVMDSGNQLAVAGSVKIDLSSIPEDEKNWSGKRKFHPSGIAKNPLTHEWYVISAVNKLLIVLDEGWKVKEAFPLNPSVFTQPEGIAFNDKGDLYISNEGGDESGNILLFQYQK
jgi:uncharacterized protein YjiK